ncbi:MAG TPA: hypothetical protein VFZ61_01355 [Polyangiales bacterium]
MTKYRSAPAGEPASEVREVIQPFPPLIAPLSAVRSTLIQASLAELKKHGYYDHYTKLIAPASLEQLLSLAIAPCWIPVQLALDHYDACERMQLNEAQFAQLGLSVGDRVQDVTLIAPKHEPSGGRDLWQSIGALHRMWPRLFQGGGVQVVKVGAKALVLEERGFQLNRFHYYRQAHVAAVRATHSALGAQLTSVRLISYQAARDEMIVRVEWQ